jgi:hypothetical protein
MGKRELLLIAGFIVLGALVYQATAPQRQPGESRFNLRGIVDEIRREVRGRHARAEVTLRTSHSVPPGVAELRVTLQNTPVTVIGETRDDIASELWVRSNGVDEAEAKALAGRAELRLEPAGPTMTVSLKYPPEGSQQGRLLLKVPSSMLVEFGRTNVRIEVTDVAGLELEAARGETIVRRVKGRVVATHRGGEFTLEDIGSVRLTTRGSDLRLGRVAGDSSLTVEAGDVRAGALLGPVEIDSTAADISIEDLQQARGPLRVNAVEGSIIVRGLGSEARLDGRETEIDITMHQAASVAIFNTGDRVQVTLPRGGVALDAISTGGRLTLPERLASQIPVSGAAGDKEQRAAGNVDGGGPTLTIRVTGGDIRINDREP